MNLEGERLSFQFQNPWPRPPVPEGGSIIRRPARNAKSKYRGLSGTSLDSGGPGHRLGTLMPGRLGIALLTCLAAAGAGLAGCSSDPGAAPPPIDASMSHDADFSKCQDTPAVIYMPGAQVTVTSSSLL